MGFQFLQHWDEYLPAGGGHVVAVAGGRGRLALLRQLADRWHGAGVPVAAAGFEPREPWQAVAVGSAGPGTGQRSCRLLPPPGAAGWGWLDETAVRLADHLVLVDLGPDGEQRIASLPPAGGRPETTGLLLHVVDLSAVGRPAAEVVTAGDPLAAEAVRNADPLLGWMWDDALALLCRSAVAASPLPPWALVLLELDGCRDAIGLFDFIGRCMDELPVPLVTLGSIAADGASLRTAVDEAASPRGEAG